MINALFKNGTLFLTLVFISGIFLVTDYLGFMTLPKQFLQTVTAPIQYGLYKTSNNFGKQFEFIFLARRSVQENKALTEQLTQILSENATLRKKLGELAAFSEQTKSLNPQTFNLEAARPIGINRYLLIDKGSDNGLKPNQAVVYKDNFIGKTFEVSPKRSTIILSSDPDSHIAAFSQNNEGRAKGVLSGQFGADLLMDKILHEEKIAIDDLVYSEGTEVEIPRGLILGRVSEVIEKDAEAFKSAKVKPIFDVRNLDLVFVVTN